MSPQIDCSLALAYLKQTNSRQKQRCTVFVSYRAARCVHCDLHIWQDSTITIMIMQAIMQAAQMKTDGKAQRVIVTGCLAQRYSEDLAGTILLARQSDWTADCTAKLRLHSQSFPPSIISKLAKSACTSAQLAGLHAANKVLWRWNAEQLPEADMIMGFQNYSSLPRHLRGMLGLSPELDPATYSEASRTQVCNSRHHGVHVCLCRSYAPQCNP